MSKAQRLRELEAENVSLKHEVKRLKEQIVEMQDKNKMTIGNKFIAFTSPKVRV